MIKSRKAYPKEKKCLDSIKKAQKQLEVIRLNVIEAFWLLNIEQEE